MWTKKKITHMLECSGSDHSGVGGRGGGRGGGGGGGGGGRGGGQICSELPRVWEKSVIGLLLRISTFSSELDLFLVILHDNSEANELLVILQRRGTGD